MTATRKSPYKRAPMPPRWPRAAQRTKPIRAYPFTLLLILFVAALFICGCGGSSVDSVTHIQGSSAVTTKATLDHWMRSLAAGDMRQNLAPIVAPPGLVSEPANYPECLAAAKKLVPKGQKGRPLLTDAQITTKCHQLYQSVKAQAVSFLLSSEWTATEADELGVHVSDAEVRQAFAHYRKEAFPKEGEFHKYISERGWTLSDMLYRYRKSMLVSKILPKFEAKVKKAGGGEKVYYKLAVERYHHLISRTSCDPGYIVPECKEYREPSTAQPAPRDILLALVHGQA